ncbi:MAG TPA: fumarylacetoacetate hydrolase family protein, partial [Dehalococcoidia bacterium]|nr:fumarylacetoacetate hydrolase family protein [Dehalococcoidia bacterium]
MRLVSYLDASGDDRAGIVRGDAIIDLVFWGRAARRTLPQTINNLIEMGPEGLEGARAALEAAGNYPIGSNGILPLEGARLTAPIPNPRRNIICLGRNYVEHALESAAARGTATPPPAHPVYFTKATTAINGPFDPIPYDPAFSTEIDWEVELGVILGTGGRNILEERALDHVFGYTVINDVTARDLQNRHLQWHLGKSFDGSCPMGPWIVTADDLPDPHTLRISLRVNGVTKQDSNTSYMAFRIPRIVKEVSAGLRLEPGDVILTGTPSGVGFARKP